MVRYKITGRRDAGGDRKPSGLVQFRFSANHGRAIFFMDRVISTLPLRILVQRLGVWPGGEAHFPFARGESRLREGAGCAKLQRDDVLRKDW